MKNIVRFILLWLVFAVIVFGSTCVSAGHKQVPRGKVFLRENLMNISWNVNVKNKTIRFTIHASVDRKFGWFLVGFMPKKHYRKPKNLEETRGDCFVLWSARDRRLVVVDCNTMHNGSLEKDVHEDYHSGPITYDEKKQVLKAIVWRSLDTNDSKDVPIKHGPMFIFGSSGMQLKKQSNWKGFLKKTYSQGGFDDSFASVLVTDMLKGSPGTKEDLTTYSASMVKEHWIGIMVGVAAFLTIIITCTVYSCTRRASSNEFRKKKVSVSFYKEDDNDDEAKVSFLHSEDT